MPSRSIQALGRGAPASAQHPPGSFESVRLSASERFLREAFPLAILAEKSHAFGQTAGRRRRSDVSAYAQLAARTRSSPKIARSSSVRPAPTSPAMPSTSPLAQLTRPR